MRRLVEKRTLVFLTLAILVWAVSISSLAGYLYLQDETYAQQIDENQQSLKKTASNYDDSVNKYNILLSEYSMLYGSYSFSGANFTSLMDPFGRLIDDLKGNYSSLLMVQEDLNETYCTLKENYQLTYQEGNVTGKDFERLLNEYHDLFNLLAIRELSLVLSETVTLTVNVCIDYGNGTIDWYNDKRVHTGSSLFQLAQKTAEINYTYYPLMKPGHILVNSINDKKAYTVGYSEGWSWIWHYLDEDKQNWISGPVGCDAWMLKNSSTYKWKFEHWSWP